MGVSQHLHSDLHSARRSDSWTCLNASVFQELLAVSWPGAAGSEPAKRLLAQPEHGLTASVFGSPRRSPLRLLDLSECICFPGDALLAVRHKSVSWPGAASSQPEGRGQQSQSAGREP